MCMDIYAMQSNVTQNAIATADYSVSKHKVDINTINH
jgi:hypothetical protein